MDRKLDAVGHRVETQPGCGLISDITHAAPGRGEGGKIGAAAKGRDALQAVLKKATAAVGKGIHGLCAEGARGRAHYGDRCWVPRWCLLGDRLTRHNRGKERSAVPTEFKTEPSWSTHGVGLAEAPATGVSYAERSRSRKRRAAGAGATAWVWECGGSIRAGPGHRRGPRRERSTSRRGRLLPRDSHNCTAHEDDGHLASGEGSAARTERGEE